MDFAPPDDAVDRCDDDSCPHRPSLHKAAHFFLKVNLTLLNLDSLVLGKLDQALVGDADVDK